MTRVWPAPTLVMGAGDGGGVARCLDAGLHILRAGKGQVDGVSRGAFRAGFVSGGFGNGIQRFCHGDRNGSCVLDGSGTGGWIGTIRSVVDDGISGRGRGADGYCLDREVYIPGATLNVGFAARGRLMV
jgi:hypothetical protein